MKIFLKIFAIALLLISCGSQVPFSKNTLRVVMSAEPDTLNPLLASDAYASRILDYVNDTLIERDHDTLDFKPKLAERWEIAPDYLSYTFYLRKGVTWQDGAPFTADDIVYSFEKIQDPSVEAPFLRVYYADIKKVEKIDDLTVKFIYSKPYFLGLSVCGTIPLISKHLFSKEADFNSSSLNRAPVGLGPYRFSEWKTNRKIVLTRNDNYWGEKPTFKKVEFKIVTDDTVALQLLKKNEIDFASLRPIQWIKQTGSERFNQQFTKSKYLLPGFNYIGWNNKSAFFKDKRVRLAMTHMVNREKILEKINYGLGKVVESPFFIDGKQYNQDLKNISYDPIEAKALLKNAGWIDSDNDGFLDKEGKKFTFKFLYPSGSKFSERVAPILKEDLKAIGIEMNIERMEWAAFLEKIEKKEFDATALGWSSGFEDDPYQVWHSSQAKVARGSNFIGFENAEVDHLIESARVEFDEAKRNLLYKRMQEILQEQQPYTFLFSSYSLVATSNRLSNVVVHKTGVNTLEWEVKE